MHTHFTLVCALSTLQLHETPTSLSLTAKPRWAHKRYLHTHFTRLCALSTLQLHETPTSLSLTAKPRSIPLGPLSRYTEAFAKVCVVCFMCVVWVACACIVHM